jgi:hypothetical protein
LKSKYLWSPFLVRIIQIKKIREPPVPGISKSLKEPAVFKKITHKRTGSLENVIDLTILRIFGRTAIIYLELVI